MRRLILVFLLVLACAAAGLLYVLTSERGLRFTVGMIESVSGGSLKVGSASGSMMSGWVLDRVEIDAGGTRIEIFEISTEWQPGRLSDLELYIEKLDIRGVHVRLSPDEDAGSISKNGISFRPVRVLLPVTCILERMSLSNLSVWDEQGSELASLDKVLLAAEFTDGKLLIKKLSAESPEGRIGLSGSIDTSGDWPVEAKADWAFGVLDNRLAGNLRAQGTLTHPVLDVAILQPFSFTLTAELTDLFDNIRWILEADLEPVPLSTLHTAAGEGVVNGRVRFSGDTQDWSGRVDGSFEHPLWQSTQLAMELSGNLQSVTFNSLNLSSPYGALTGSGMNIHWQDELSWQGRLTLDGGNPGFINDAAHAEIGAEITTRGSIDSQHRVSGKIEAQDIRVNYMDHLFTGAGVISAVDNSFALEKLELVSGDATLAANGGLVFNRNGAPGMEVVSWQGRFALDDFDPSLFLEGYPGLVSMNVSSRGKMIGDDLVADVTLENLVGELRGYPFEAQGSGRIHDGCMELESLGLYSGNSTVQVSGRVDDELGMNVVVTSPDIGELVANAGGELALEGNVRGTWERPVVHLLFSGEGLSVGEGSVGHLKGVVTGSPDLGSQLEIDVSAKDIRYSEHLIDSTRVKVGGTADAHDFLITLLSEPVTVEVGGSGSIDGEFGWNGVLEKSDLMFPGGFNWSRKVDTQMKLSSSGAELTRYCLTEIGGKGQFCMGGNWSTVENTWSADVIWDSFNISRINTVELLSEQVYGIVWGEVHLEGNTEEITVGRASGGARDVSMGRRGDNGDWELADIDDIAFDMTLYEAMLQGGVSVTMADTNSLNGTLRAENVGRFDQDIAAAKLSGQIRLEVDNLDFVAPLTEYYVYPTGDLDGTLNVFGTLGDPRFSGTLELSEGTIDFPTFGVRLADVTFAVSGEDNVLAIRADGISGPGRLYADGSLTFYLDDLVGEFNFAGEGIDVFELPEYTIRADPDLRLVFDTDGGALLGELTIPYAVITPEEMTNSLYESDDVVFLDSEQEEQNGEGWIFKTLLDVTLGDEVSLDGYGITGKLVGDLQVEKLSGSFVTGIGVLALEDGQITIYGRSLDIERGRVLFGGGPIDDPGVDVRAQRQVADQDAGPNGVIVGVDVSGTAESLDFKLFSEPGMDESDILAYMVVGRPMSSTSSGDKNILGSAAMALGMSQGTNLIQGLSSILPVDDIYFEGATSGTGERLSLVVGKKLTDELFVGYDHNFFDQLGEVTIRYELGRGFYVESRTSAEATGADLLFSFER